MYELRAKSTKESEMLMYGSIGEWDRVRAVDFIAKISDVKAKGYENLKLKINSPGGSQFEGLAIMSQMGTKEVLIHGVVEGIAASMAAIILQGCHRRSMVKGTRLMVHHGSGVVFGSANNIRDFADLVSSMDKTLAEILAKRSKRDAKYILENWMADGKDTWFTPEEALKEGLIDDIIEGKVVPLEKEQASLLELAAHYEKYLDNFDTTENAMNKETKESLVKELNLKAEATDAEILAAITNLKAQKKDETKEEGKGNPSPESKGNNDTAIEVVMIVAKERGVSDEMLEKIKKVAATDVKLAMELLPEKKKEESISVNDLLKELKGSAEGKGGAADRKNWDFKEWQKNDPNGLLAMAQQKPGDYAKLFEGAYGYKPSEDEIKKLAK